MNGASIALAGFVIGAVAFGPSCAPKPDDATETSAPITGFSASAVELGFAIEDFQLSDHRGRPFARSDLLGRVWVVNFAFTSCPTVCPDLTRKMSQLVERFEAEPRVAFATFTVDPENDTPARMTAFLKAHGRESERWYFVGGDPVEVDRTILQGFKMVMSRGGSPQSLSHAERFVVLSGEGRMVGLFETDPTGLNNLEQVVRRQLR